MLPRMRSLTTRHLGIGRFLRIRIRDCKDRNSNQAEAQFLVSSFQRNHAKAGEVKRPRSGNEDGGQSWFQRLEISCEIISKWIRSKVRSNHSSNFFFAKTRTSTVVFKYLDRFKWDPKIVKTKTDRGKKTGFGTNLDSRSHKNLNGRLFPFDFLPTRLRFNEPLPSLWFN